MKKFWMLLTGFVAVSLTLLIVFLYITGKTDRKRRDMAAYNDMKVSAEEAYASGTPLEEIELTYGCRIVFAVELSNPELAGHYAAGVFVLDFAPEGNYIGKITWPEEEDRVKAYLGSLKKVFFIFWNLVFVFGLITFALIYVHLLRPEQELSGFAAEIAKGNLDIPLPMQKQNAFGSLAEGLDLMREELVASKEKELKADRAKKELVAGLSHDIKTPVAVIRATCEVMELSASKDLIAMQRAGKDDAEIIKTQKQLDKLKVIRDKAETISRLMDDVFHTTMTDLEELTFDVKEVSSTVIADFFRDMKDYGNVILENEIPECLIYADTIRLEQAIDNIVSNSAKYAGTDIHVAFSMTEGITDEAGGKISFLSVRIGDEGPGVPEEELPFLAEKYYRGSAAKEKTGYGLGLYLVKEYMDRQGGGVEFYNDGGFVANLLLKKV